MMRIFPGSSAMAPSQALLPSIGPPADKSLTEGLRDPRIGRGLLDRMHPCAFQRGLGEGTHLRMSFARPWRGGGRIEDAEFDRVAEALKGLFRLHRPPAAVGDAAMDRSRVRASVRKVGAVFGKADAKSKSWRIGPNTIFDPILQEPGAMQGGQNEDALSRSMGRFNG